MFNDELSLLGLKYGTDKGTKHTYTPYYFELLKERKYIIKKVLEIGTAEGASLFMWRDFFPNATIYGAEIDPARVALMEGQERIKVIKCDQTSEKDLKNIISYTGTDIDLIIDDGSHIVKDQIFTCKTLVPIFQKHLIYIIEDVQLWHTVTKHLTEFDVEVPELIKTRKRRRDNHLIVVRQKPWEK